LAHARRILKRRKLPTRIANASEAQVTPYHEYPCRSHASPNRWKRIFTRGERNWIRLNMILRPVRHTLIETSQPYAKLTKFFFSPRLESSFQSSEI
jgi:hypothetical protein